jgi:CRISPR-associated protein Csx3
MKFLKTDLENFQIITIDLEGEVITSDILENLNLPGIDYTKGVVIDGRAPIWLYGYLLQKWHLALWTAVNTPHEGGAIVTKTHDPLFRVGTVHSTALIV